MLVSDVEKAADWFDKIYKKTSLFRCIPLRPRRTGFWVVIYYDRLVIAFSLMDRIPVVTYNVQAFRPPSEPPPTLWWVDCVNTHNSPSHHYQIIIHNAVWSPSDATPLHLRYLLLNGLKIVSFLNGSCVFFFFLQIGFNSGAFAPAPSKSLRNVTTLNFSSVCKH